MVNTFDRIQIRTDLASEWSASNAVLKEGEPGHEKDTGKIKYGDGVTPWNSLPYASAGPQGPAGPAGIGEDPDNPGFYLINTTSVTQDPAYPGLYTF